MEEIPNKYIYLEQLEEMFSNIETKTGWNTKADLLWGYFFTDNDSDKLVRAGDMLEREGYRIVKIFQPEESDFHMLHVEMVETHSPRSLNERNDEFYRLANKWGLRSYDGMDVGPAN